MMELLLRPKIVQGAEITGWLRKVEDGVIAFRCTDLAAGLQLEGEASLRF